YLFASAFTQLDGLSVTIRGAVTLDDLVGRAYSLSTCAPERLAAGREEFERDLRETLAPLADNGKFIEIAELAALLARRPGPERNSPEQNSPGQDPA
ncbi:MAG TPA: hypothetical protein VG501_03620, partial [Rhizomicrobium sp.]|nr:hypothetical protein [Rhizomicrobium sp.]